MPTYDELCQDPKLADLPYRIETDRYGNIVMSPHWPKHSLFQTAIQLQILDSTNRQGIVMQECAVETTEGTKVPDLVWISSENIQNHNFERALSQAPDVCVEVKSNSNSHQSLRAKFELYFEKGAQECWMCDGGKMRFFGPGLEEREHSHLIPGFPSEVQSLP